MNKKIILILSLLILVVLGFFLYPRNKETQQLKTERDRASITSKANEFENIIRTSSEWKRINKDFKFILKVNNKEVPIVQTDNNDYYIHNNIYKEEDFYGVPYVDRNVDLNKDIKNIIIYGHSSTKRDLVFSFIKNYDNNDDYWKTNIIVNDLEYKPIALFKVDQNEGISNYMSWLNTDYNGDKVFMQDLYNNAYDKSNKNFDLNKNDLVTLVTCNLQGDDNQRYIMIFAR